MVGQTVVKKSGTNGVRKGEKPAKGFSVASAFEGAEVWGTCPSRQAVKPVFVAAPAPTSSYWSTRAAVATAAAKISGCSAPRKIVAKATKTVAKATEAVAFATKRTSRKEVSKGASPKKSQRPALKTKAVAAKRVQALIKTGKPVSVSFDSVSTAATVATTTSAAATQRVAERIARARVSPVNRALVAPKVQVPSPVKETTAERIARAKRSFVNHCDFVTPTPKWASTVLMETTNRTYCKKVGIKLAPVSFPRAAPKPAPRVESFQAYPAFGTKATSHKEVCAGPSPKRQRRSFRPVTSEEIAAALGPLENPGLPAPRSVWDMIHESGSFAAQLSGEDIIFTEREKPAKKRPERVLAKKPEPLNDYVKNSYEVATRTGGKLVLLQSDIRPAVRSSATFAVCTSRDFKSANYGFLLPLPYLYKECQYPKPTADDFMNSRLTVQDHGGKRVYSLIHKDLAQHLPKIAHFRESLHQLAEGLLINGDHEVTMPFLGVGYEKVRVETLVQSVLELLCERGISVRLCTDSTGQFFAARRCLVDLGKSVSVVRTDDSTPEDWVPVEGNMHYHVCYACNSRYSHWHAHWNKDHPQFDRQCPNPVCKEFHKGRNYTNSQLVKDGTPDGFASYGVSVLSDPEWVRAASIFPAAIESAISGAEKSIGEAAYSVLSQDIPALEKEEVIELRKTGYSGAVASKPKPVEVIHVSSMVGLAEKRKRPVKVDPIEEFVKFRKNYATSTFNPDAHGKCCVIKNDQVAGWLSVSGRSECYQNDGIGTFYRSGENRHHNKRNSQRAAQWLKHGWNEKYVNRYNVLRADPQTDISEEVPRIVAEVTDPVKVKPRKCKAAKHVLSDEYWMAYFASEAPPTITYEFPKNPNKLAKKAGVRVSHLLKEIAEHRTKVDLSGNTFNLAQVTETVSVADKVTGIVSHHQLSDKGTLRAGTCFNGKHQWSYCRYFDHDGWLNSGSPILNSSLQLTSLVTLSINARRYMVLTKDSQVFESVCTGEACHECKLDAFLTTHAGKNRKSKGGQPRKPAPKRNGSNKPSASTTVKQTVKIVEAKMRSEAMEKDLAEVTRKLNNVAVSVKKNHATISSMATSPPPMMKPKTKKTKKKAQSSAGFVAGAVRKINNIVGVSNAIVALSIFALSLLSLCTSSTACFTGFQDRDWAAGLVNCSVQGSELAAGHYLSPDLGGNLSPLNIVSGDDRVQWYAWLNALIRETSPSRVIISKCDDTAVVNGHLFEREVSAPWSTAWLLASIVLVALLVYASKRLSRPNKTHRLAGVVYRPTTTCATALLCILGLLTPALASPTFKPVPQTADMQAKVENAKKFIEEVTAWMSNPGKTTLADALRAQKDLHAISQALIGVGDKIADTPLKQVEHLKSSLATRVNEITELVARIGELSADLTTLRKKIEELEAASSAARVAFDSYKALIKRDAKDEPSGLENVPYDDLAEMSLDLETKVDTLIDAVADYERTPRSAKPKGKDDSKGKSLDAASIEANPLKYDLIKGAPVTETPSQPGTTQYVNPSIWRTTRSVSGSEKSSGTNATATSNTASSSTAPAVVGQDGCWATYSAGSNPSTTKDSALKVRGGVNSDVTCDTSGFSWALYEDYMTCNTHGRVAESIGSGSGTCGIGLSAYEGERLVIRKAGGEKKLCSVACFTLDAVIKALRYNTVLSCRAPLLSGAHWDVGTSKDDVIASYDSFWSSSNIIILADKLIVTDSTKHFTEYKRLSSATISACCNGYLATELDSPRTFYDGPCLCKANLQNIEKRIQDSLIEYYTGYMSHIPQVFSIRTITSVAVVLAVGAISPTLGVCMAAGAFVYNANADCATKNFHTLYVGDSSTKQIYTTLYMSVGDCFTLGENTFELIDIDNVYSYKMVASYPSELTHLCSDMDWGCGLSEGSKICSDYNKDCENKCNATSGALYKRKCISTTTFHGDGCYGFLVQDHSVSVHGGVCLLTNMSTPYYGYSRVEGLVSRKFTLRVTSFERSRDIVVDSKNLIYEDSDFTIQDIVIEKNRIPTYVLDAGSILCSYTDVTGNDFCHSVVSDTSKLTNPGCVNLDWTFLGDEQKWEVRDESAIITPYVYDLFETCDSDTVRKDGDLLKITPRGITLAFKIDSQYKTSAFTVTRCTSLTVGGHESMPGFIDRVQTTQLSVSVKSGIECYISLRVKPCSLVGANYCKVGTSDTICDWTVYCAKILDAAATLVGDKDFTTFNFTSGKFSAPTITYSRTFWSTVSGTTSSTVYGVVSNLEKAASYIPGFSFIKNILTFGMQKVLVVVLIGFGMFVAVSSASYEGAAVMLVISWVYFFTDLVHAYDGEPDEAYEIQLWHLILVVLLSIVDWCKLFSMVYTFICRRASGYWHKFGCDNLVIGIPFIDTAIYFMALCCYSQHWVIIFIFYMLSNVCYTVHRVLQRPQSVFFNTEALDHSPVAKRICVYISRNSACVGGDRAFTITELLYQNIYSAIHLSPRTCFLNDLGYHLFNSPPDSDEEPGTAAFFEVELNATDEEREEFDDENIHRTIEDDTLNNHTWTKALVQKVKGNPKALSLYDSTEPESVYDVNLICGDQREMGNRPETLADCGRPALVWSPSYVPPIVEEEHNGELHLVKGDIISHLLDNKVVAHCGSSDWDDDKRLSQGVAVDIIKFSGMKKPVECDLVSANLTRQSNNYCVVYTLLTKRWRGAKPTVDSLSACLSQLAEHMRNCREWDVYMPAIGIGLDKLSLRTVLSKIREIVCAAGISVHMVINDDSVYSRADEIVTGTEPKPGPSKDEIVRKWRFEHILLHPLLAKHSYVLGLELKRHGFVVFKNGAANWDFQIHTTADFRRKGDVRYIHLKFDESHLTRLSLTSEEYRSTIEALRTVGGGHEISLQSSKQEQFLVATMSDIVDNYDVTKSISEEIRYFVCVPLGGGFEDLEPKMVPNYVVYPEYEDTATAKASWARDIDDTKIVIVPSKGKSVPKNWIYVACVYINSSKYTIGALQKHKHPSSIHENLRSFIRRLSSDDKAIGVAGMASIVSALNVLGNSVRQRIRDNITLKRPNLPSVFSKIRNLSETDLVCEFHALKAAAGDHIALSVGSKKVSVYKEDVKKFVGNSGRKFLTFVPMQGNEFEDPYREYGHCHLLYRYMKKTAFKEGVYCVRQVFQSCNHELYCVANRHSADHEPNVEISLKGILEARMLATDTKVTHMYVCFPDNRVKKGFSFIISKLVREFCSHGIELTLLMGRRGEMKIIVSHVNAALKMMANNEPVDVNTSMSIAEETVRKDLTTREVKTVSLVKAVDEGEGLISVKLITDAAGTATLAYVKGEVDDSSWLALSSENEFFNWFGHQRWGIPEKHWGRHQWWLYDSAASKIVGLLPLCGYRPKHFGFRWHNTKYHGVDVEGQDGAAPRFAPKAGLADRGGKCSYMTEPLLAHDNTVVNAIYTTEMKGRLGSAVVLSLKRLMSGSDVHVMPEAATKTHAFTTCYSQGFITTSTPVKVLGVSCYVHPISDWPGQRIKATIDYLNDETSFSLRTINEGCKLLDRLNAPVEIPPAHLRKPDESVFKDRQFTLTEERIVPENDPLLSVEPVDIAPVDVDLNGDWYDVWSDFNFTAKESDPKSVAGINYNLKARDSAFKYHGHVVCPRGDFALKDSPCEADNGTTFIADVPYAEDKIFCSRYCAKAHNACLNNAQYYRATSNFSLFFDNDIDINSPYNVWTDRKDPMGHPCLPELSRLVNAMASTDFNRVQWYDHLLEDIEEEDVFMAYTAKNAHRYARFNRELDATCSTLFDFPDTMDDGVWITPGLWLRGPITTSSSRTGALAVHCSYDPNDRYDNQPLKVLADAPKGQNQSDHFYVHLRRALVLLLSEGWNYVEVILDKDVEIDVSRFVCCCVFSVSVFGPFSVNICTVQQKVHSAVATATQFARKAPYTPAELTFFSNFLWNRGVKTAAILESVNAWNRCRNVSFKGEDVAELGLNKEDCPEIILSQEHRPAFMGDDMCSIWNISNGIKTGSCFANGMQITGNNHCTMGNDIVIEAPTLHGSSLGTKRARFVNKLACAYENGDIDMHNGISVYAKPKRGEIYCVANPAQKRGRWLMCAAVDEYEPISKTHYNKFVPVDVYFGSKKVEAAPYQLYKGLSGSPIIGSKGQCVGTYGLSTNVRYVDKNLSGSAQDTTMCHSMVTDCNMESENYFAEAARELLANHGKPYRFSYLEAPTGTGKSTLFPLAVLNTIVRTPGLNTYNICMLEPTRAAVHNCYNRIVSVLQKGDEKWRKLFTIRLSTGKRGETAGEHFKSEGTGKIALCIATYGRFIAEYKPESPKPHAYDMLLMDEIHTRSSDEDVGTAFLLSSDQRNDNMKICYMTATSVGKVCERRLCEGKDLAGTRYKIDDEYIIETKRADSKESGVITDSSYFTIDLSAAGLYLRTKAQYVSWPFKAHAGGRCLVFLPSRNDCEKFVSWAKVNYPNMKDRFVSLHAGSSIKDLNTLPPEAIIGCTDFASTAITVPNCNCVVDFMEDWTPIVTLFRNDEGFTYRNSISKEVVTKQVSTQRRGRTGRTCKGKYYSCASIHPIEETKLTESMYARIYFNLLIKMGKPRMLRKFLNTNEEASRIYEHGWLEPDKVIDIYACFDSTEGNELDTEIVNKFAVTAPRRLEIVRNWDKDQLWWYLNPVVGQDYVDFCMASENAGTHGFGVSNQSVNMSLRECWTVVPTDTEAEAIRERHCLKIESYIEDMRSFDNYVQRAHDKLGSISVHTLAKKIKKVAPRMYEQIDKTVVDAVPDAAHNVAVEARDNAGFEDKNVESGLGITLGAGVAAAAIAALMSSGLFAYNRNATWQAVEVYSVSRLDLPHALYTFMEKCRSDKYFGTSAIKDPVVGGIDAVIDWIRAKWQSISAFIKNLLAKVCEKKHPLEGSNQENATGDVILNHILAGLATLKGTVLLYWYKNGALNIGSMVAACGMGAIYNRMCNTFGLMFSNAIVALTFALSSIVVGPKMVVVNAVCMILSYVTTDLLTHTPGAYGAASHAARAGALLFTTGGASALAILLQGAFLSKPVMSVGPNVTNGVLSMINPYNTGVSRVSDGVIIAKMIANMCRKGSWTSLDGVAAGSTLMSMIFRADAMTCMVAATAGLFLGFARVYMGNSQFWFKMASAMNIKHADTLKDLINEQMEKFDSVFDGVLLSAGILANPMSLVSIVCNIISDVTVAYMKNTPDIAVRDICWDNLNYYSGVSAIYGISSAVMKVCFQLRDSVTSHFEQDCFNADIFSTIISKITDMAKNFNLMSIWGKIKEVCSNLFPEYIGAFNYSSDNVFSAFLSKIWDFISGMVKSAYDWCVDKTTVLMKRFERRITNSVSKATSFNFGTYSILSSTGVPTVDDPVSFLNGGLKRAAYLWAKHLGCPINITTIVKHMDKAAHVSEYIGQNTEFNGWFAGIGLYSWAIKTFELDCKDLVSFLKKFFPISADMMDTLDVYSRLAEGIGRYLIFKKYASYEDLIGEEGEGRFDVSFGNLDGSDDALSMNDVNSNDEYVDSRSVAESMDDVNKELASDVEMSPKGIEYVIGQITAAGYDLSWLDDMRLCSGDEKARAFRDSADPRFWCKIRLQETADSGVLPLLVQAMGTSNTTFGEIPNEIVKLDSDIYFKPDASIGSGDYISGFVARPWDVVCMDNVAMAKLFSPVCDVADHGTHITLSFLMKNGSSTHISISHSFSESAACLGLLCQTQDPETKLINADIAGVEIFMWPSKDGIHMLGTCPPNAAGTWNILYDSTLKYLPFFRDFKTQFITMEVATAQFENWSCLATPLEVDEIVAFDEWKEKFLSRRFAAKGWKASVLSATTRKYITLATKYSTSMQEGKEINEKLCDPAYFPQIRMMVSYKSYYKDFAEAAHGRVGVTDAESKGLPDGVEDVRLYLNEYAMASWFSDLTTYGSEDVMNTTQFKVRVGILSGKEMLHHPAAYISGPRYEDAIYTTLQIDACKAGLARQGFLAGHNVIFMQGLGNTIRYEMAAIAGVCKCTVTYLFAGNLLRSAMAWKCSKQCLNPTERWTMFNVSNTAEIVKAEILTQKAREFNVECDSWLCKFGVDSVARGINMARGLAARIMEISREDQRLGIEASQRVAPPVNLVSSERAIIDVCPLKQLDERDIISITPDQSGVYISPRGLPVIKPEVLRARKLAVLDNVNSDRSRNAEILHNSFLSPAANRLFDIKRDLGDRFMSWIHDLAIEEKFNQRLDKTGLVIEPYQVRELESKYSMMTVSELMDMAVISKEERDDILLYLDISKRNPVCTDAPWCDGWDAVAVKARDQDFWLTDGNMHLYRPHDVPDSQVVQDICRVEKLLNHLPKEVWEDTRYKNRMELPGRENDIGNVYASRAALKAQLLYEYLPGFFNNHKVFFEPCCGFGGFAQYFSHQMRSMEPRKYLVSSLNKRGHAMPNWSLMQASDSNCKVVRVLDDHRDGNICDPMVNAQACSLIKGSDVTCVLFDIGERFQDPNLDDGWYLTPRNVKGGFDTATGRVAPGLSICEAISKIVEALPDGGDGLFKINTFSNRVVDIIHYFSASFKKVRALKLATTPESSREFYLFCSNKKTGWSCPNARSILLKDCVKELTWNALYRAENMFRSKGKHAMKPRSHKWFTPDSSGICYKMIPNTPENAKELDVTQLPQGHAMNVSTTAHGKNITCAIEMTPDWDRRYRSMKDFVIKTNKIAKSRSGRGRDNVKFDKIVRSDFTYVRGIGSFTVKQKAAAEKHGVNDLIGSYLNNVAGMNMTNITYGQTQGTQEYVKPALKKRLDVQPGQPEPTCVVDYVKAVHCIMSEAGRSMLGRFRFMTKEETYAQIVKTGSTGILDPGSNLKEFMEIFPEWYELAWEHVLNPHLKGAPTSSYQSVRIKPEPKGRKDAENGRLQYRKGVSNETLKEGTNLSPRFIQFSDALTRIGHIIVFGHILNFHGKHKLYKGSINGTPPHISGRVMRAYWDLHNPVCKRVCHLGNNKELDISVDPKPANEYTVVNSNIQSLDSRGRLNAGNDEEIKAPHEYEDDLPAGLTIDFSALDSTVTVSERMVMTDLWKRFFDGSDEKKIVEGVCRDMIYAICLDDAGNIWVRDGQRGSGEILTSIENTWLVTANIIATISHALGVSIDDLTATQGWVNVLTKPGGCGSPKVDVRREIQAGAPHKRFEFGNIPLLVDGDDVVIISTRRLINQMQDYMNQSRQWLASNRKVIRSGNKGGATRYLNFEELSFCSHRYEAVFIGPDASKFNPKYLPSGKNGRHPNRSDLLSVAEDRNFKIYFLPIRPVADILAKLMLTLKVKSFKWDPTRTEDGQCVDLTQSKLISYLLLYPQCRWVRYTCLTLLCVTGDNLATFTEFKKRYQEFDAGSLKTTSKLLSSMHSLYGVGSLDDISLRDYRIDFFEIRKQQYNSKLTGHTCQTTRAKWLQTSFDWLGRQQCTDTYPLMWDSAIFKYYEMHAQEHPEGTKHFTNLKEMIQHHVRYSENVVNNTENSLWQRIISFAG
nr:polyprotein [Sitobion miscanthi flavi-like virus 1]